MDYSYRDIPMRLDIRYQPLSFDVYMSQLVEVPRTSLEEEPYDFKLELDALEKVDRILERTQKEQERLKPRVPPEQPTSIDSKTLPPPPPQPSCPTETPLTPIKSTVGLQPSPSNTDSQATNGSNIANQINLREFEDTNYNPFDHLELQTIDELRELNLVFQAASYANTDQVKTITNEKSCDH